MLRSIAILVAVLCFGSVAHSQRPTICTGGIINAKALYLPIPLFPESAKLLKAHTISVRVVVNENGWVSEAKTCSGDPLLRSAAEAAAWKAKIKPTVLGGKAMVVSGVINYRFDPATSFDAPYELPCLPTMNIIKVVNPYAVDLVRPDLPANRPPRIGAVSIQVLIGEDGRVEQATAVAGNVFAREASVTAALRSTFRRFVRCGEPTKLSSILTYNIT